MSEMGDSPHSTTPARRWRTYIRELSETSSVPEPTPETSCVVGLIGTFTVDPLLPHLGGELLQRGIEHPEPVVGPFGQVHQACLDPHAVFDRSQLDVVVVLWRLEDLAPDLLDAALASDPAALDGLLDAIDRLADLVAGLERAFDGTVIVSTPPYPGLPTWDPRQLGQASAGNAIHRRLVQHWMNRVADLDKVLNLDLDGLLRDAGQAASQDPRTWYLYRQPYVDRFWSIIGNQLARLVVARDRSPRKCLVVDCDNTIWGGVIGEDGLDGIELGQDFPGSAFRDFQKVIQSLARRGIFIAVASRNNLDDVLEVFDRHDEMVLRREDVSVFEVHWNSKVDSLRAIARALNIGTDALVFIDDNPKEIAEVRERLPEVACLLASEEPAELPGILLNTDLFDTIGLTEEDRERVHMMHAERKRDEVRTELSEDAFLASLELKVDVFEAGPSHLARVTQLINKTNQFNLTTIRRTREEIDAISEDPDARILAMRIEDRFGAYGLVGVAILRREPEGWNIDTLLMSCRVLGRGAETAFLAKIGELVRAAGGDTLLGTFTPTRKNALVEDLYPRHGFTHDPTLNRWTASVDDLPDLPGHVAATLALDER